MAGDILEESVFEFKPAGRVRDTRRRADDERAAAAVAAAGAAAAAAGAGSASRIRAGGASPFLGARGQIIIAS